MANEKGTSELRIDAKSEPQLAMIIKMADQDTLKIIASIDPDKTYKIDPSSKLAEGLEGMSHTYTGKDLRLAFAYSDACKSLGSKVLEIEKNSKGEDGEKAVGKYCDVFKALVDIGKALPMTTAAKTAVEETEKTEKSTDTVNYEPKKDIQLVKKRAITALTLFEKASVPLCAWHAQYLVETAPEKADAKAPAAQKKDTDTQKSNPTSLRGIDLDSKDLSGLRNVVLTDAAAVAPTVSLKEDMRLLATLAGDNNQPANYVLPAKQNAEQQVNPAAKKSTTAAGV